jgi:hypothetical protein
MRSRRRTKDSQASLASRLDVRDFRFDNDDRRRRFATRIGAGVTLEIGVSFYPALVTNHTSEDRSMTDWSLMRAIRLRNKARGREKWLELWALHGIMLRFLLARRSLNGVIVRENP